MATEDEQAIRDLIERWAQAVRGEDLDGIRRDHADDILMFDVPPPFASRGLEAYMATWQTFFAWTSRPVVFHFSDIEVNAGDTVAFATAVGSCRSTERDGSEVALRFRLTMGLRKRDGRWVVAHEHHSIPATD